MHSKPGTWVLTPHGRVHITCYHKVADQRIDTRNTGFAPCAHPPHDIRVLAALTPEGWVEAATATPSVPLGLMSVTFTVPDPPVQDGGLIYLFSGAQNAGMSTILQPVLQWGWNGDYGGDYWSVACWHATKDGHTVSSGPIEHVEPGSTIVGTVRVVSCSDDACDWDIDARVFGKLDQAERHTVLHVTNLPDLLLFLTAGALEVYPEDACCPGLKHDQYPAGGSTDFRIDEVRDLSGAPLPAHWNRNVIINDGTCVFDVSIANDMKSVVLNY